MDENKNPLILRFFQYKQKSSPCNLGPALAILQSRFHKTGKLEWLYPCLYPIYVAQIKTPTHTRVCFFDAYLPLSLNQKIARSENLQSLTDDLMLFAETATLSRGISLLEKLEETSGYNQCDSITNLLPSSVAENLLSLIGQTTVEDINWNIVLKPNREKNTIQTDVMKLINLENEEAILNNVMFLFEKAASKLIFQHEQRLDETFQRLSDWKTLMIDQYTQNRNDQEQREKTLIENLRTLRTVQQENLHLIEGINRTVSQTRSRQSRVGALFNRSIHGGIQSLKKQKKDAIHKQREYNRQVDLHRTELYKVRKAIGQLDLDIKKTRETMPADLTREANDFKHMKTLYDQLKNNLIWLQSAHQETRDSLLIYQRDVIKHQSATRYVIGNTIIHIQLVYLPLYFIKKQKYLGLQKTYFFAVPGTLPTSLTTFPNLALQRYFTTVLAKIPKSDLKKLKKIGREHNSLEKAKIIADIHAGLTFLSEEKLITGFENYHLRNE